MLIHIYGRGRVSKVISGEKMQQTIKSTNLRKGSQIELSTGVGRGRDSCGDATVTDVIKLRGGLVIGRQRETTQDSWAKREGFASFEDADELFSGVYGPEWQGMEMDVIYFKGDWLEEEVQ